MNLAIEFTERNNASPKPYIWILKMDHYDDRSFHIEQYVMDHVPSTCMHSLQEQRKTLPINGAIYAALKKVILILLLKI